jgi:hypothetical protein
MRKTFRRALIASFLIVLMAVPQQMWAWGSPGHMAVAYVAWQKLNSDQKSRIIVLLNQNPFFTTWSGYVDKLGLTGDDHDAALFMYAATWPDEIKFAKGYKGTDTPPPGVTGTETGGVYTDMQKHKYWHFIDTPYVPGSTTQKAAPSPNAQLQIIYFSKALKTAANDKNESYDLVWLEHLVGDIHQPLHATSRFIGGTADIGGNDVKIVGDRKELHAYWDDLPGVTDEKNPENDYTSAMAFVATLQPAPVGQAADLKVADWTAESYKMAKSDVYVAPIGKGLGPYQIDPGSDYANKALQDAQARVELAGERLASLIQSNLK